MIRVVGGSLRSRKLTVPPGVRPTTERARKAIFDVLSTRARGARVLDAAAGSGAFGIEALSRGAREVVFVEASGRVARVLEGNLERLGLLGSSLVVRTSVAEFSSRAGGRTPFDLIFHDPPWSSGADEDLPALFLLLEDGGTLVHERGDGVDPWPGGPVPVDERRYGETRFLLYRR